MTRSIKSASELASLAGKVALVTGANRGLGFEIAAGLAGAGATVVLACRDPQKGTLACAQLHSRLPQARVETMTLDLANLASVRGFADTFAQAFPALDILCNNGAAIMVPLAKTIDGFEMHFGTNHLGHFALTGLLMPRLRAATAARIVNSGSIAHRLTPGLDLDDVNFERTAYKEMDAYGRSKLATLLYTYELDRRLRQADSRIVAAAAHPGYAATNTDLGGFWMRLSTRLFAQPAPMGALPALYAATASEVHGGDYFGPGGLKELRGAPKKVESRAEARDPLMAQRLWTLSEQLTGVRYLDA